MIRTALLMFAATMWMHASGRAAPLDCARATSELERAICSNGPLSDANAQIDVLYTAALSRLSAEGGEILRDGQQSWMRFLADVCPLIGGPQARDKNSGCLYRYYVSRVRDLQQVALQKGPFLFNRVDHYSVTRLSSQSSGSSGIEVLTHHSATPRIDQPITPITVAWNQIAARPDYINESDCGAGNGDTSLDYRIGFVSAHVISVEWETYFYCPGAPHGADSASVQTLLLGPPPRPLGPTDIFRADSGWHDRLDALLLAAVRETAQQEHVTLDPTAYQMVSLLAADPRAWSFTPQNFEIRFGPYALGAGRDFHPDAVVPWSALREFMVADPAIP